MNRAAGKLQAAGQQITRIYGPAGVERFAAANIVWCSKSKPGAHSGCFPAGSLRPAAEEAGLDKCLSGDAC